MKAVTSAVAGDGVSQAGGSSGSGRPGRKRAKTGGATIAVPESVKEAKADISMLPPSSE